MKTINSPHNPTIKLINNLKKKRNRDKLGLCLVEGKKEINLALKSGKKVKFLNFSPGFGDNQVWNELANIKEVNLIDTELFANISYREHPDGYLAVVEQFFVELDQLQLSKPAFLLVLQNVEKPGNLGAILRTADAAGVEAIILNDQQTDIFNPNVIRASLGAIFTVPVVRADKENTQEFLANNKIISIATSPEAPADYTKIKYKQPVAVLIGEEHSGLDDFWLKKADFLVSIPMQGQIDSLNASVSAAILAYEVVRQRGL